MAIEYYADIDLNSNLIHELGDGLIDSDGVNLGQVRQAIRDLDWKQSVRVATNTNLNLAAPGASIDGVAMSVGDRILVKAQTLGQENGIYEWNGAATPATRSADADSSTEVTAGLVAIIEEGTNADQLWLLTTNNPIIVGTTVLSFTRIGGLPFAQLVGDGVTQTIAVTHNLGTRFLHVTVYRNSGLFSEVTPEVRHTDNNTITLRFTPAPALNEFYVVIS
jgi:hypothetical protein